MHDVYQLPKYRAALRYKVSTFDPDNPLGLTPGFRQVFRYGAPFLVLLTLLGSIFSWQVLRSRWIRRLVSAPTLKQINTLSAFLAICGPGYLWSMQEGFFQIHTGQMHLCFLVQWLHNACLVGTAWTLVLLLIERTFTVLSPESDWPKLQQRMFNLSAVVLSVCVVMSVVGLVLSWVPTDQHLTYPLCNPWWGNEVTPCGFTWYWLVTVQFSIIPALFVVVAMVLLKFTVTKFKKFVRTRVDDLDHYSGLLLELCTKTSHKFCRSSHWLGVIFLFTYLPLGMFIIVGPTVQTSVFAVGPPQPYPYIPEVNSSLPSLQPDTTATSPKAVHDIRVYLVQHSHSISFSNNKSIHKTSRINISNGKHSSSSGSISSGVDADNVSFHDVDSNWASHDQQAIASPGADSAGVLPDASHDDNAAPDNSRIETAKGDSAIKQLGGIESNGHPEDYGQEWKKFLSNAKKMVGSRKGRRSSGSIVATHSRSDLARDKVDSTLHLSSGLRNGKPEDYGPDGKKLPRSANDQDLRQQLRNILFGKPEDYWPDGKKLPPSANDQDLRRNILFGNEKPEDYGPDGKKMPPSADDQDLRLQRRNILFGNEKPEDYGPDGKTLPPSADDQDLRLQRRNNLFGINNASLPAPEQQSPHDTPADYYISHSYILNLSRTPGEMVMWMLAYCFGGLITPVWLATEILFRREAKARLDQLQRKMMCCKRKKKSGEEALPADEMKEIKKEGKTDMKREGIFEGDASSGTNPFFVGSFPGRPGS